MLMARMEQMTEDTEAPKIKTPCNNEQWEQMAIPCAQKIESGKPAQANIEKFFYVKRATAGLLLFCLLQWNSAPYMRTSKYSDIEPG